MLDYQVNIWWPVQTSVHSIYFYRESLKPKTCPGVPAGPPPLLVDYIDDGSDDENEGGEGGQSAGNKAR